MRYDGAELNRKRAAAPVAPSLTSCILSSSMFVYIARHAWAGERGDPRWPDDSLRPLTPEGIERYDEVVKTLAKRGFAPARIATSPYARCRQTAEIIAKRVAGKPPIEELDDSRTGLRPGAAASSGRTRRAASTSAGSATARTSSDLAAALIGDSSRPHPLCQRARSRRSSFDDEVIAGGGELYWLATAKLLGL